MTVAWGRATWNYAFARSVLTTRPDRVIQRAASLFADLDATVEVRNQARVHLWYADRFGVAAPPFTSARDAIAAFASTTCSVGITHGADGIQVHAPHGLTDAFAMHLRPHRRLAPREVRCRAPRASRAEVPQLGHRPGQTTASGSSFCPVGPTWISVPISGHTPQS